MVERLPDQSDHERKLPRKEFTVPLGIRISSEQRTLLSAIAKLSDMNFTEVCRGAFAYFIEAKMTELGGIEAMKTALREKAQREREVIEAKYRDMENEIDGFME